MPDDLSNDAGLYDELIPPISRADAAEKRGIDAKQAEVGNKPLPPVPPPVQRDFAPVPVEALQRKEYLRAAGPHAHLSFEQRLQNLERKTFGDWDDTEAEVPVPEEEVEDNLHEGMRPAPLMPGEPVVVEPAAPYSPSNPRRI